MLTVEKIEALQQAAKTSDYRMWEYFDHIQPIATTAIAALREVERLRGARAEKAEAERDALLDALAFYGNISDYVAPLTGGAGKLWLDCGVTARAAIAKCQTRAGPLHWPAAGVAASVQVCPICDIAGCKHIRAENSQPRADGVV